MGRKKKDYTVTSIGKDGIEREVNMDKMEALANGDTSVLENKNGAQQSSPYKILKAEIKDETLVAEYTQRNADGSTDTIKKESEHLIHPDLRAKFVELVPHLIVIGETIHHAIGRDAIKYDKELGEDVLELYSVTGYQVKGEEVTIIGQKHLENKYGVMGTIKMKVEASLTGAYDFANESSLAVAACDYEVGEYLFNGKEAATQQTMEFEEDEVAAQEV